MGRQAVVAVLFVAALAAPGRGEDIYRWRDASGRVTYSNSPGAGDAARIPGVPAPTGSAPAPAPAAERAPDAGPDGADARTTERPRVRSDEEAAAFSTSASLRRTQLERDLRATERRLRDLDARLQTLARARTGHARGLASTGGVATAAVDLRSEEETALESEREELAQHATEVRNEAARLRTEVSQALGGTPAWWTDVR